MKLNFVQNTKRNIVAGTISRGISLLFPFLNRTLFLWLLGPKYLGLNGLFTSILGVLMLAELGFGTAVTCSMYKPIADNDHDLVCAYLRFYRTVYRCVGTFIFIIGLCLLPFLKGMINGNPPADINLYVRYLLHLTNTSVSYFLFAYRGSILSAHHRNDVLTNIRTAVSVTQYVAVFLILLLTRNYYLYVVTTVIFTMIQNLLIVLASNRLVPYIRPRGDLPAEKRRRVISDVKSIFLHKVGTVISYSIDNLLIAKFIGLDAVATYGNYYYVYTVVAGIPAIIYSTLMGGFGNRIHTASREENYSLVMQVARTVGIVIIFCAAMMLATYQPFIKVWMGQKYATLALHFLTPALMVLYFYINQSRQVLLTFKAAAGLWREDQWKPVVGGIVKLALGILFIRALPAAYRMDGVILSSIIGYVLIQIPWESHVVFTAFFDRGQARVYWKNQLQMALLALLPCSAALAAVRWLPIDWVGKLTAQIHIQMPIYEKLAAQFHIQEKITKFAGLSVQGLVAIAVTSILVGCLFHKEIGVELRKLRRKN